MFGDNVVVGQAHLPIGTREAPCLQSGYRSVQLNDTFGSPIELASLLICIGLEWGNSGDSDYQDISSIKAQLRAARDKLDGEVTELAGGGAGADVRAQKAAVEALELRLQQRKGK